MNAVVRFTSFSEDALRMLSESSNASSNSDARDRTDANCPEHVGAGHPKHRAASDCFKLTEPVF
jgi:hypothetical protein